MLIWLMCPGQPFVCLWRPPMGYLFNNNQVHNWERMAAAIVGTQTALQSCKETNPCSENF